MDVTNMNMNMTVTNKYYQPVMLANSVNLKYVGKTLFKDKHIYHLQMTDTKAGTKCQRVWNALKALFTLNAAKLKSSFREMITNRREIFLIVYDTKKLIKFDNFFSFQVLDQQVKSYNNQRKSTVECIIGAEKPENSPEGTPENSPEGTPDNSPEGTPKNSPSPSLRSSLETMPKTSTAHLKADKKKNPTPIQPTPSSFNTKNFNVKKLWEDLEEETRKIACLYVTQDCADSTKNEVFDSRFIDIQCAKETAVLVDVGGQSKYLHANHLGKGLTDKKFIATQAPRYELDTTAFWQAMLQYSSTIIDLTTHKDNISPYYPTSSTLGENKLSFNHLNIELITNKDYPKIQTLKSYDYKVTNTVTKETKQITRFHYNAWPDYGTVNLQELKEIVQFIDQIENRGAICIHCRAGVGRTGTVIAADILKEKIKNKEIHLDNLDTMLTAIILNLRQQRDKRLVQTEEQFALLIEYGTMLLSDANVCK